MCGHFLSTVYEQVYSSQEMFCFSFVGIKVISISSVGISTEALTACEGEPEQQSPTKQRKIEAIKSLSVIRTPMKK